MAEIDKSKLQWQCRRGMLELDVLLAKYLERQFDLLSYNEQQQFADFLDNNDQDLFDWLMGKKIPADPVVSKIVANIIKCSH